MKLTLHPIAFMHRKLSESSLSAELTFAFAEMKYVQASQILSTALLANTQPGTQGDQMSERLRTGVESENGVDLVLEGEEIGKEQV